MHLYIDFSIYTLAGPEIAVASTKAYTTQLLCMYLLALYMADLKGIITDEAKREILRELEKLPEKIEDVLSRSEGIKKLAELLYNRECITGNLNYPSGYEQDRNETEDTQDEAE